MGEFVEIVKLMTATLESFPKLGIWGFSPKNGIGFKFFKSNYAQDTIPPEKRRKASKSLNLSLDLFMQIHAIHGALFVW
jgi:hypothetical protein